MVVHEHERAVGAHLAHVDARRAIVELRREDRLADLVDIAIDDLDPLVRLRFVDEEPELVAKLFVEKVSNESEIIFVAAYLARALEPRFFDDALPHRKAEVIGIDRERGLLVSGEGPDD